MPKRVPADGIHKEPRPGRVRASKNQRWRYRAKGPSKSMKVRANGFLMGGVLLVAAGLTANLFRIMVIQHNEYTERASSRQFGTITLPASRGTIYDATGTVLAQSATVYRIFVDPGLFRKEMALIEEKNQSLQEAADKAKKSGE